MTAYSGTYTFASNDTGGTKDLGTTHTYRYVNATNVYNKGKSDGKASMNNLYITIRDQNIISIHYNNKYSKCEVVSGQAYSLGDAENATEYGAGTGSCYNVFGGVLTVIKLSS